MFMTIELRHIEQILALDKHRNFTRAAMERIIANRNTGNQQQIRCDSSKKVFEIPWLENLHQIPGGSCQRALITKAPFIQ
jgi:hypothetical protein